MNVIGYQGTQETRMVKWNDLLESKRSLQMFRHPTSEQEHKMLSVDQDFYTRTLSAYAQ